MATRSKGSRHALTLRLPREVWADYQSVAAAKGMDPTSLVNDVLTDALPGLLRWLQEQQDVRRDLAAIGEPNGTAKE